MFVDLFRSLRKDNNPRGHPILSALLYTFCPQAAYWWLAGAEPELPFDPVWQALKDLGEGTTLAAQLEQYDLGDFKEDVRCYIEKVEVFRRHHANLQAPETLPFFRGGQLPLSRRFGAERGIRHLGGEWENLFAYARAWAFLYPDWLTGMRISQSAHVQFRIETIALTLNGIRLPVYWDAPVWQIQTEHVRSVRIGALIHTGEQDWLRMALFGVSSPQGKKPWDTRPQVFALNPQTGQADPARIPLANGRLPQVVETLARAAKNGPYFPLHALRSPSLCKNCGYVHLCYQRKRLSSRLFVQ